jgi:hypothetical protein
MSRGSGPTEGTGKLRFGARALPVLNLRLTVPALGTSLRESEILAIFGIDLLSTTTKRQLLTTIASKTRQDACPEAKGHCH